MEQVFLSRKELRILFEDFSDKVHNKIYKRADYYFWGTMNVWTREGGHPEFRLLYDGFNVHVTPWVENSAVNPLVLNADDMSLGTYLCDMMTDYIEYNYNNIEENNNMAINNTNTNPLGINFRFGPVPASVRMSMYGMAIKNAEGTYVAYDGNSDTMMNVDILNFEGADRFMYQLPVAVKDVAKGDVVIHNNAPCFVLEVGEKNRFKVLDIYAGEEKTMVASKSPFNFDFITKVVSFIDFAGAADADNPFGNMWPLLLLNGGDKDNTNLALMMMMSNGKMDMNPMMMYALLGGNNDILPFLLVNNMNKGE